MNTRLEINKKILEFYSNSTGENIDFDIEDDRIKLSMKILESSGILSNYHDILKYMTNKYYKKYDLNPSYTEEFHDLIEFIFYEIINEKDYNFNNNLKNELIEEISGYLEKSLKLKNHELNNETNDTLDGWKEILGDNFNIE